MTWYGASGTPATKSFGSSAAIRSEFSLIAQSFAQMPVTEGNQGLFLVINSTATGITTISDEDAVQALGLVIGTNVQGYTDVLQATTASFTEELETNYSGTVTRFEIDHSDSTGKHKQVTIPAGTDKTAASGEMVVYAKVFNGRPELYIRGPGQTPMRLTQNGQLFIDESNLNGEFASIRTLSFFRGKVTNLGDVSGTVVLDWESGTIFRMNITGDLDIELTGMPDAESEEDQVMYFDATMDGEHAVGVTSDYGLIFPGGPAGNTGFTPDGRDWVVCATSDGEDIAVIFINNMASGDIP